MKWLNDLNFFCQATIAAKHDYEVLISLKIQERAKAQ